MGCRIGFPSPLFTLRRPPNISWATAARPWAVAGSKLWLTDFLKGSLAFQGFLISDYKALNQIDTSYKKSIDVSINSGINMVMVPDKYREFIALLTELVNEERVPMSRINDAVTRIMRVKMAMELMDSVYDYHADRQLEKTFGSAEHRFVARVAVRESMVLLKNENKTLPMSKWAHRIVVAGKSANNIGVQSGGWTIGWQGGAGDITTGGTTILQAVRNAVSHGTEVMYSPNATHSEGADAIVLVIGEQPYAEMKGDRTELALDSLDQAALDHAHASNVPVVVVVISGRPIDIAPALANASAVLAAWLPGTEGDGVADVLFGDYHPTGKLSYTWPRSAQGSAESRNPLFPFGFGLTF